MPNLRGKTWTTTTPANVEDAQYWEDHLISDTAAAKAASSVQSVNSITPDQYGNVEIGNAGHTIQDDDGNDMPKQDVLQFVNADVTNDTVNEKTVVDCKGAKGDAATITVGTVTTLPAGSDATVTNSGTSHAAVFNFGIPQGEDGSGAVDSVNGKTGTVVLDASDVGALPDSTTIPTKTSELDNDSGFVTSSAIPTSLSELSDDSTHRLVTDAEKTAWDAKVSESLLKDTVGWVGKNELPLTLANLKAWNSTNGTWSGNVFTHTNGPTFTVSTDDEGNVTDISVTGSPSSVTTITVAETDGISGSKILNGIDGGSQSTFGIQLYDITTATWLSQYATDGDANVTLESGHRYRFAFFIRNGVSISSKKIYPMLRKAEITDKTFCPYHKSVEDWYWENNPNAGVHNLTPYPYQDGASKVSGVVTFTVDSEGVVNANASAAVSDFATYTVISAANLNALLQKYGDLILSRSPEGTSGSTFQMYTATSGGYILVREEETVLYKANTYTEGIVIQIIKNATAAQVTNIKFKPMLRLASDTNSTYQPYAMTNRELTEDRYYHAGDTVNVSLFNFSALCTNSSKDIRCTIPLSKDVSKVSNFTFKNTTTVSIRKPAGGYVIDGLLNAYTVTMLNMKDNFISFKITKTDDSAFDAPNNCCLDLAFTAGSNDSIITFS